MNITTIIVAVVIAFIGSGAISYFISKREARERVEGGKKIGASEEKDKDREEASDKAKKQVKKNKEIIKRNREAVKKAREARGEKNTD